jgi:hypothetical protein
VCTVEWGPDDNELEAWGAVAVLEGVVRFDVFTAVSMKNVVFWDIKMLLVPHRRHITSPLQS